MSETHERLGCAPADPLAQKRHAAVTPSEIYPSTPPPVLRQGLVYAGIGLPLGLLGAWLGSRAIAGALFSVSPTDPITYALVAVVLFLTVVTATFVPARAAGRTDPVVSLREE